MKIGFNPESIVDLDGKPLVGRVTLYAHDSDDIIDVYTLEGDTFVLAENPQLLNDAGRLDETLFFDAAIIDVMIERYVGAEGQMSVESPDSDFEQFDIFETGFAPCTFSERSYVDNIAGLMDASTSLRVVEVLGYYDVGDCVPRTYYWDKDSVNDIDGGYVVGSNVSDTGRWILLWGSETLPASFYGVMPGNESNMALLMSYPATVGSIRLATAPSVRFQAGTYTSTVNYTTSKHLVFDAGARFPQSGFACSGMEVHGEITDNIAIFGFSGKGVVAHSSWFRTVASFLGCNADKFVVDAVNHFEDTDLGVPVTLSKKTIVYTGNTRLPVTYVNSGRIVLDGCNITGSGVFNPTDKLTFKNTVFTDDWFAGLTSMVDFSGNVSCKTSDGNTILLDNFKNVNAYANAVAADGQDVLDLAGRSAGYLTVTTFSEIRNAFVTSITVAMPGANVRFTNVHGNVVACECANLDIISSSVVQFNIEPTVSALWCYDSVVTSSVPWTAGTCDCHIYRCRVGINFDYAQDNSTLTSWIYLFSSTLLANYRINCKRLAMRDCSLTQNPIKVYPHMAENGHYTLGPVDIHGNIFYSDYPIEFTKFDDEAVYNCRLAWSITGNSFVGVGGGLKCRYWSNRSGANPNRVFVAFDDANSVVYWGNAGWSVPADTGVGLSMNDGPQASDNYVVDLGGGNKVTFATNASQTARVVLSMKGNSSLHHYNAQAVNGNGNPVGYTYDGSEAYTSFWCSSAQSYVYPWAAINETVNDGDLFQVAMCKWGEYNQNPSYPGSYNVWKYI